MVAFANRITQRTSFEENQLKTFTDDSASIMIPGRVPTSRVFVPRSRILSVTTQNLLFSDQFGFPCKPKQDRSLISTGIEYSVVPCGVNQIAMPFG
jgi:hypothetical protein